MICGAQLSNEAKKPENVAPIPNVICLQSVLFCIKCNEKQIEQQTGHNKHTQGVTVSHLSSLGTSCCWETIHELSLIQER